MEKDKINIFNSYIKSIFDFNAYNFFYKKSLGKAFLYLFFLTIVLGGLSLIRPLYNFNTMLDTFITNYPKSAPEFNFKDGIFTVDSDIPLVYGDSEVSYIIDTSGKTKSSDLTEYLSAILITKDNMYQKDAFGNIKVFPFDAFKELSFDKISIGNNLTKLKLINILIIVFYPIKFFLGYLLNALILAVIALLLNSFIRSKTTFKDFYKLSIYGLTLSTTFNLILSSIDTSVPSIATALPLIFYGVGVVYIIKALTVIKLNEN